MPSALGPRPDQRVQDGILTPMQATNRSQMRSHLRCAPQEGGNRKDPRRYQGCVIRLTTANVTSFPSSFLLSPFPASFHVPSVPLPDLSTSRSSSYRTARPFGALLTHVQPRVHLLRKNETPPTRPKTWKEDILAALTEFDRAHAAAASKHRARHATLAGKIGKISDSDQPIQNAKDLAFFNQLGERFIDICEVMSGLLDLARWENTPWPAVDRLVDSVRVGLAQEGSEPWDVQLQSSTAYPVSLKGKRVKLSPNLFGAAAFALMGLTPCDLLPPPNSTGNQEVKVGNEWKTFYRPDWELDIDQFETTPYYAAWLKLVEAKCTQITWNEEDCKIKMRTYHAGKKREQVGLRLFPEQKINKERTNAVGRSKREGKDGSRCATTATPNLPCGPTSENTKMSLPSCTWPRLESAKKTPAGTGPRRRISTTSRERKGLFFMRRRTRRTTPTGQYAMLELEAAPLVSIPSGSLAKGQLNEVLWAYDVVVEILVRPPQPGKSPLYNRKAWFPVCDTERLAIEAGVDIPDDDILMKMLADLVSYSEKQTQLIQLQLAAYQARRSHSSQTVLCRKGKGEVCSAPDGPVPLSASRVPTQQTHPEADASSVKKESAEAVPGPSGADREVIDMTLSSDPAGPETALDYAEVDEEPSEVDVEPKAGRADYAGLMGSLLSPKAVAQPGGYDWGQQEASVLGGQSGGSRAAHEASHRLAVSHGLTSVYRPTDDATSPFNRPGARPTAFGLTAEHQARLDRERREESGSSPARRIDDLSAKIAGRGSFARQDADHKPSQSVASGQAVDGAQEALPVGASSPAQPDLVAHQANLSTTTAVNGIAFSGTGIARSNRASGNDTKEPVSHHARVAPTQPHARPVPSRDDDFLLRRSKNVDIGLGLVRQLSILLTRGEWVEFGPRVVTRRGHWVGFGPPVVHTLDTRQMG
ncbi:hypothetical protein P7C73_g4134, partial [Tremellales sp. Uapishka_1]